MGIVWLGTWLMLHVAVPAVHALEADITTSRGVFTIVLEPDASPLATANFILLAEGGRLWKDGMTGALGDAPFYNGLDVVRTVQDSGEKFFEAGPAGPATPGYEFQDELDGSLGHVPYVVTMATLSPNTNSGSIRVFGAQANAARNGRHTVIGRVPAGPGRPVVDSIISAGAGETVILSVTIREREEWGDLLAMTDELLPRMTALATPSLVVMPGISTTLHSPQPARSVLAVNASADLIAWQPLLHRFLDGQSMGEESIQLDHASLSKRFYHPSLAIYPDSASGPSTLGGATLTIQGPSIATIHFTFDESGMAGTYQNVVSTSPPPLVFNGSFTVVNDPENRLMPYSTSLLVNTPGLGAVAYQRIRVGWDDGVANGATGRHETQLFNSSMQKLFQEVGPASVNLPANP